MFPPLITSTDLDQYECPDAIADALIPAHYIAMPDAIARAIGHADNYASDEQGSAASVYPLTATDLNLYRIAAGDLSLNAAAAFVRSDDSGFWDVHLCETEDEASTLLDLWTAQNAPTYEDEDDPYAPTEHKPGGLRDELRQAERLLN